MAFDAGFTSAIVNELSGLIVKARVEKLFQPSKDSLLFTLHSERKENDKSRTLKLIIDCGSTSPRIAISREEFENPKVPPMFCMLLRKHLNSAKIMNIEQIGFERVVKITFETRDELGYLSQKYIYAELMGKFSNLIFCDGDERIISAFHMTDLSSESKRAIVPGIKYELPPKQEGKVSPLDETKEGFLEGLSLSDLPSHKFIVSRYFGISPLVSREICQSDNRSLIWEAFEGLVNRIKNKEFIPTLITDTDGNPIEYSFIPITQYGSSANVKTEESFSALIEGFFAQRSKNDRLKQRASDILKLLTNAQSRLSKRIDVQRQELEECSQKDKHKKYADLITANLYALKRGMTQVSLTDYYEEDCPSVTLVLDSRLTPAQNAQKYYKKYNKLKNAESHLKKQIENGISELLYLDTVFDALTRAENEADLNEIRKELYESGYASRMKNFKALKMPTPKPSEYRTSGGWKVLCGKNNAQNDYITNKLASKGDIWFHVKDYPGSHVVLFCDGYEPDALDYNEAAILAAYCSKAPIGQKVTVDYTRVKNIKKPPSSKPGYVTFASNYSAVVTADEKTVSDMKQRAKEYK